MLSLLAALCATPLAGRAGSYPGPTVTTTPLDTYFARSEPAYRWSDTGERLKPKYSVDQTAYIINVTSLQWLSADEVRGPFNGSIWSHRVAVVVPHQVQQTRLGVVVLTGGCNDDPPLANDEEYLVLVSRLVARTGTVGMVVYQSVSMVSTRR